MRPFLIYIKYGIIYIDIIKVGEYMQSIITSLVEYVLEAIGALLIMLIDSFTDVFGYEGSFGEKTLNVFVSVFPFMDSLWELCYYAGFFILFTIMVWQIFKAMFGDLSEAESPTKIVAKGLLTGFAVSFSATICLVFFKIGSVPYNIIDKFDYINVNVDDKSAITGLGSAGVAGGLAFLGASPVILSFVIIVALSILIQEFFKLLCESVERYVILGILTIFSPMCIATAVSGSTNRIFGSWFRMMISQAILMSTNVLFLKGFAGGFVFFIQTMTGSVTQETLDYMNMGSAGELAMTGPVVWLMLVAWLKIGQKIDEYLNMLGLSAAISGGFGTSILSNLRGASMTANSMINSKYGTRYGAPGEAKNPITQLFSPMSQMRNRRLDQMRTDGVRKTQPSTGVDALARRMGGMKSVSKSDLAYAQKNGIPLSGAAVGKGFAKSNNINTDGWGKFTNNSKYDPRTNTVSLEAKDKDGNITRATYGFDSKGNAVLQNAQGTHVESLLSNSSPMDAQHVGQAAMSQAVFDSNGNIIPGAVALDENNNAIDVNGNVVKNADDKNPLHQGMAFDSDLQSMYENANIRDMDGNKIEGAAYLDSQGNARDINGNMLKDANEVDAARLESMYGTTAAEVQPGMSSTAVQPQMSNAVFDSNNNIVPGAVGLDKDLNAVDAQGNIVRAADDNNPMHEGMALNSSLNSMYSGANIRDTDGNKIEGAAYLDAQGNARDINGNVLKNASDVEAGGNIGTMYKSMASEVNSSGFNTSSGVFDSHNNYIPGAVGLDSSGNAIGKDGEIVRNAGAEPMHMGSVDNLAMNSMLGHASITDSQGNQIQGATYLDANGNARGMDGHIVKEASEIGPATAKYGISAHESENAMQGFIHSGMAVPNASSISTDGMALNSNGEYITDKFGSTIRAEQNADGTITSAHNNVMMAPGTSGCVNAAMDGKTYTAAECNTNIDDAGFSGIGSTAYVWGNDENGNHDAYRITNPGTRYDVDSSGNYTESSTGQYVMRSSAEGGGYIKADMTSDGVPEITYRASSHSIGEFSREGHTLTSGNYDTDYYASGTTSSLTPETTSGKVYISSSGGEIYEVANSGKNITDGGLNYNSDGTVTCLDPYHSGQTIGVKPKNDTVYSTVDTVAGFSYSNGMIDTSRYDKISDDLGVTVWKGSTDTFEMRDAQTLSNDEMNHLNSDPSWISHKDKIGNEYYMRKNNDITTGSLWTSNEGNNLSGAQAEKFMDIMGLSDFKGKYDHIAVRNSQAILYNNSSLSDNDPDRTNSMVVTANRLSFGSSSSRNTSDGVPYNITPASIRTDNGKITFAEQSKAMASKIAAYEPKYTSNTRNVLNRINIRGGTINRNVRSRRPVTEDFEEYPE